MARLFAGFAVLALGGCGLFSTLDRKAYSASCAQDSDCVQAFFGDQCAGCGCPNAAISKSAQADYEADRAAALRACGPIAAIACSCAPQETTCAAGVCQLK